MRTSLVLTILSLTPLALAAPEYGTPVDPDTLREINITIMPDGRGLPPGAATAARGEALYAQRCASCHGAQGTGASARALAGGASGPRAWSVGRSYAYPTTFFDYVRRAMPPFEPKSLSTDELYALTAYFLFLNGVAERDERIDQHTLPDKKLPALEYGVSAWPPPDKANAR